MLVNSSGPVNIDGELLEEVTHFKYLDSIINNTFDCSQELRACIGETKSCMPHLSKIWKSSISIRLKQILVGSLVWSVATYDIAAPHWFWRRVKKLLGAKTIGSAAKHSLTMTLIYWSWLKNRSLDCTVIWCDNKIIPSSHHHYRRANGERA